MFHKFEGKYDKIILEPLKKENIEDLRLLRNKKENRLHDNVDLVPVAHLVDSSDGNNWKYELEGLKSPISDSDAGRSYQRTEKLITEGSKSIDNESLERMGYQRSGYQNRFYLGNGNTVKDIIFLKFYKLWY